MPFNTPGNLFIATLDATQRRFLLRAMTAAQRAGYRRFVEPAAGGLAMSHLARHSGWPSEDIDASDVSLFSTAFGYGAMGERLDRFNVRAEGLDEFDLGDPATVLWGQTLLRYMAGSRSHMDYWKHLARHLYETRDTHIGRLQAALQRAHDTLDGYRYRALDMWAHLDEVVDDAESFMVLNPPTFKAGFERFYDTGGRLSWDEPPYDVYDPAAGAERLGGFLDNAKGLVVVYNDAESEAAAVAPAVYVKGSTRKAPGDTLATKSMNVYLSCNRPDEFKELTGGLFAVGPTRMEPTPLPWPVLPRGYDAGPNSRIEVVPITLAQAAYYRLLWTHRFRGTAGTGYVCWAARVDGHLAGVFGLDGSYLSSAGRYGQDSDTGLIVFGMSPPHDTLRLNRLLTRLELSRWVLERSFSPFQMQKCVQMSTLQMSQHPESKELRGLMKLTSRAPADYGYRLVYEGPLNDLTPEEALGTWLEDEKRWQKSRASTSSQRSETDSLSATPT